MELKTFSVADFEVNKLSRSEKRNILGGNTTPPDPATRDTNPKPINGGGIDDDEDPNVKPPGGSGTIVTPKP